MSELTFSYSSEAEWETWTLSGCEATAEGVLQLTDGYLEGTAISPWMDGTANGYWRTLLIEDAIMPGASEISYYFAVDAAGGGATPSWHGPYDAIDPITNRMAVSLGVTMEQESVTDLRYLKIKLRLRSG